MEFKEIAKGVKIPVIGLGTWKMGGDMSPDISQDRQCIAALKRGVELGMTHIDTAEIYSSGHAEEIVGEAIKDFDRDDLFITSKVWRTNLRYADVIKAAKGGLKRMGVDQMDLYLVHWPNPKIPLKETMEAMENLIEQGLTKFIGVSNFSVSLMKEAQSYLEKARIVANQVEFSLMSKDTYLLDELKVQEELLPFCQKEKVMLVAYSPLGRGEIPKGRVPLVNEIARKYGKTPSQVALNWLVSKNQVITIPKASNIKHVEENAGAVEWKIQDSDMEKLDKIAV